jgi:hypothetical protein
MSTSGPEPTEEDMRVAYEAELKRIRVEHVLLEHVVMLVNLGMRRTGLAPGTESERDPGQVQLAIEAIRAVMPLVEQTAPQQAGQIRQALSQLQLAYVRIGGLPPAPAGEGPATASPGAPPPGAPPPGAPPPGAAASQPPPPAGEPPPPSPASDPAKPGEGGPAQRSGRLWIPGQ